MTGPHITGSNYMLLIIFGPGTSQNIIRGMLKLQVKLRCSLNCLFMINLIIYMLATLATRD